MPVAVDDFDYVRNSGLIESLVAEQRLVAESVVDKSLLGEHGANADRILEHPRLPFISYPYEWSFSALKAAALLHLDILQAALQSNVAMTDATAYNVQFNGPRPIFIDSLSFRRYNEGEYWAGHRQFCEQFVNPLLLGSVAGISHNAWYRGSLEGITAGDLSKILPWHSRVVLECADQRLHAGEIAECIAVRVLSIEKAKGRKLPRIGLEQILHGLSKWIGGLELKSEQQNSLAGLCDRQ